MGIISSCWRLALNLSWEYITSCSDSGEFQGGRTILCEPLGPMCHGCVSFHIHPAYAARACLEIRVIVTGGGGDGGAVEVKSTISLFVGG